MSESSEANEEVRRLFYEQVPELAAGVLEIKALARKPGVRTKVGVCSHDERVDPVGSFVGQRGMHVKEVVRKLGEKVDVIRWSESPKEFIQNSVAPARIARLLLDEPTRFAVIYASAEDASAIRGPQDVHRELISELVGWDVQVVVF